MLGKDKGTELDGVWDELKGRARTLVDRLEAGDFTGASSAIEDLNEARDRNIYREVGKLTRGLHEAIVNFDIGAPEIPNTSESDAAGDVESKMTNAQDRLDYVINLTQSSADKTMDMVEEGIPLASAIGDKAVALREDWGRLLRREMDPEEFRDLYRRIDEYLAFSTDSSTQLSDKLNTILLAQDFQDLTGQVIKKVISLVQEVEERLVELMRVAGQVEELTGIVRKAEVAKTEDVSAESKDVTAEGPQINAEQRNDVVSGQDDVDDLLSSLGF
ncbi:protein phosphatase CheZ [Oceanicoccus sp. KOV_DT_Chl]|uniref:protein phosphatase CheZ n=1 Tax=Oceanicoccus sp. KOV_DT_Chl TaxID=1904639 RepID=UPI000C7CACD6|nr:protein phosphatase CheZ [Oceanicoccus sp. KOV_DT_Chl]